MKEKIKKILKNRILIFILGGIVFGTIGVSAATYFESNLVTYDNTESGLSSSNVQGAIDELYTECTKEPTTGETIIDSAGLEKDEYECRYFFTGGNPNNIIILNNEQWRILSVECDGRIKIIRGTFTTNYEWDSSNSNNWNNPSSLNTLLNGTYYNDLNSAARNQIVVSKFSTGAVTAGNNDLAAQINDENFKTWNGNIALPTVSEYIRTNSNKNSCGTFSLFNNNHRKCISTGWMDGPNAFWLLSPSSGSTSDVFSVMSSDAIGAYPAGSTINSIRPALYLSSDVTLSGSGTQSDPYRIE